MENWFAEHWLSVAMLCAAGAIFLVLWIDKRARRKEKEEGESVQHGYESQE